MSRIALTALAASALLLAGCGGEAAKHATLKQAAPKHDKAISRSFEFGDRSLYLQCAGSGRPTVVMDAGMANDHDTWKAVAPAISKLTRTCTYDRAFEGLSDPLPCCGKRTSADIVADLRRLLSRAGVAPPYLLVGHSFGGLNMRLFAGAHPRDVLGLVLINPTGSFEGECSISATICANDKTSWEGNPERIDIEKSTRELAATRLPPIPLILLLNRWERDPSISARLFKRLEMRARRDSQRLVASVPDGRLEIVPGGHFTQDDHPAIVINAISAVLKKAR